MTDAELRALVRDSVARHLAGGGRRPAPDAAPAPGPVSAGVPRTVSAWGSHPSHYLYLQVVNTTEACVIEPAVACDHCGYCRSHGH